MLFLQVVPVVSKITYRQEHVERVEGVRWGEASRRAANKKNQFERKKKMTKKLAMTVGTARRAVRNLALLAAVTVAIGARADEETVGGYT